MFGFRRVVAFWLYFVVVFWSISVVGFWFIGESKIGSARHCFLTRVQTGFWSSHCCLFVVFNFDLRMRSRSVSYVNTIETTFLGAMEESRSCGSAKSKIGSHINQKHIQREAIFDFRMIQKRTRKNDRKRPTETPKRTRESRAGRRPYAKTTKANGLKLPVWFWFTTLAASYSCRKSRCIKMCIKFWPVVELVKSIVFRELQVVGLGI